MLAFTAISKHPGKFADCPSQGARCCRSRRANLSAPPECSICFGAPPTLTSMPCGHQCVCTRLLFPGKKCAEAIFERQECPMCYAKLDELMEAENAVAKLRREGKRAFVC
jgi:hypothetical protein